MCSFSRILLITNKTNNPKILLCQCFALTISIKLIKAIFNNCLLESFKVILKSVFKTLNKVQWFINFRTFVNT